MHQRSFLWPVPFLGFVASQYFPPTPEGLSKLQSKFHPGVAIFFKESGLCETTDGVKSYSGYVHLPPDFLDRESQNYPINTSGKRAIDAAIY